KIPNSASSRLFIFSPFRRLHRPGLRAYPGHSLHLRGGGTLSGHPSLIISEQNELGNHFNHLLWNLCTVQMFCHERKSWRRAFHLSRAFSITEGWSRPPAAEPKV